METIDNQYLDEKLEEVKSDGFLDYRSDQLPTWCPGCGYFGITQALYRVFRELEMKYEDICCVSGIGCAGRFPIFMNTYGFHTLHGRSLPVASGMKLSRNDLTVIAVGGDGDAIGIGGGHLPHAARRNVDITFILFDNGIYGLTKGQSSPTTPQGMVTATHPYGNPDVPLRPVSMALAYNATFVARCFAGEVDHMQSVLKSAIQHRGFSFIHVLSPCVTFDKENITWKRMRGKFSEIPDTHDPSDHEDAVRLAENPRLMLGLFYQDTSRLSYHDYLEESYKNI